MVWHSVTCNWQIEVAKWRNGPHQNCSWQVTKPLMFYFKKNVFSQHTDYHWCLLHFFFELISRLRECHSEKACHQPTHVDVIAFCSKLSSLWTAVNFTRVLPAELVLFFLQHQTRKYERVAGQICWDRYQQRRSGGSERVCRVPKFTSYASYQTSFLTVWQGKFFFCGKFVITSNWLQTFIKRTCEAW